MMKKSVVKKKGPGRPSVAIKKKPFQVMLDPRYIDHFRKVAQQKHLESQDLARMALQTFVPDPFNPVADKADFIQNLLKKT